MNRERAKELLPVIQAFADGKTIQVRGRTSAVPKWTDILSDPSFFGNCEYRIKPEPRTLYVIYRGDGLRLISYNTRHGADEAINYYRDRGFTDVEVVEFVEKT